MIAKKRKKIHHRGISAISALITARAVSAELKCRRIE